MNMKPKISIGADGVDVEQVVSEILASVEDKRSRGIYDDARVARAERNNILILKNDETFMERYLQCLRMVVAVDINDFEIFVSGSLFSKLFLPVKKLIWKVMKFYTYRLWSQQNQTNSLLLAAIEVQEEHHKRELANLRERLEKLEAGK